ncbi:hypothetical protein RRG08_015793 [Elysia crispata]|uniref:Uncharacterized protein n=1 Tax=Elysia crispata TaxID=231223 RepID=A0AAE1CR68_9GAST|nr:hypothetical protein RRG08_015793 [Elysia crispata]
MSGDCCCFVLVRTAYTPCACLSPVISPDCGQRCQVTAAVLSSLEQLTHLVLVFHLSSVQIVAKDVRCSSWEYSVTSLYLAL